MPDYERFCLVFDSATGRLGQAAVRLLELGLDVLYASDLDEATLLARQEAERLGAVLLPAGLPVGELKTLLSRLRPYLAAGPRAFALAGPEPDAQARVALRGHGIEWGLWEPYEERELRFLLTAAMATEHADDRRKALRLPTALGASVFMGRHRQDVTVHDLSAHGAYMATPTPFLEGSPLSVDLPLPNGPVVGKAQVVNAKTPDKPGRPDMPDGMGVAFTRLSPAASETLLAFLDGRLERFRL